MLSLAMIDIRFIARFSWPLYAVSLVLLGLGAEDGPCRQGRGTLVGTGPDPDAAQRIDEGGAGDGAGGLVQPGELVARRQSAFPHPAGGRGGRAGAADPQGAQSGHRVHHRRGRCLGVHRRRHAAMADGAAGAAAAVPRRVRLQASARLPARPHHHFPQSGKRPARRRLQHHPVQDRAGLGRHVGQKGSCRAPRPI